MKEIISCHAYFVTLKLEYPKMYKWIAHNVKRFPLKSDFNSESQIIPCDWLKMLKHAENFQIIY